METERWHRIKHLYQSALEKEEPERTAFLEQACVGDSALKSEVEALLEYEGRADQFIESSALEVAAKDLADNPAGSLVGERLDHYRILSLVGVGGMGEVYRAQASRLNRTVAIKVLPPHTADRPDQKQRLEREAKAIAALNHPHICVLYDIGHHGEEIDYLVMEYLEGETLADRLRKGPLSLEETVKYSIQIADALDKAHQHGVVHRDLKPGNVMLTPTGAKLLDFGLAKIGAPVRLAGAAQAPVSPNAASPLTLRGTIVGTLQYMAPEQLEGREADARTDIFAFGAMLHEMATGQKAFQGKSQVSVMAAIMDHTPAPASSIRPLVPALLDHVIRMCMEKDPARRWQNAADVLIQLHFIAGDGSELRRTTTARNNRKREILAWGLVALVTTALGFAVWGRRAPLTTNRTQMRFEFATPNSSNPTHIAISPDSTRFVAVVDAAPSSKLWLHNLDELGGKILEYTDGAQNPFWSPDGRYIAFFAGDKLKKIGLFGAPPEIICDAPPTWGGTWSADDVILFGSESGIWRVTVADKKLERITNLDPERAESGHFRPAFLPDGKHFFYVSQSTKPGNSAVFVGSLDSRPPKQVMQSDLKTVFAPPNHVLFVRDGTLMAQQFDLANFEVAGDPWPVAQGVSSNGTNGQAAFSVSDEGHLVFRPGGAIENRLLLKTDQGGHTTGQVGVPAPYQNPVLSSDGQYVAVRRQGDIVIINAASGNIQPPLTQNPAVEDNPVWSPDRTYIAFSSTRGGVANIYVKRADSAGPEELIQKSANPQLPQSWSSTNYLLYEERDPKTKSDLWTLSMKDKKASVFLRTPFDETQAQFSPDGLLVAYVSNVSGTKEVYVRRFPTGDSRQVSVKGGQQPRWGDNGELFFLSGVPEEFMVVEIPMKASDPLSAIGEPRMLFKYDVATLNQRNSYDVMKGHGFLLNGIPRQTGDDPGIVLVLNWMKRN